MVKVYCWPGDCTECGGGPYFTKLPLSQAGDMLRLSEKHAREIPPGQLARWQAAADAWAQAQNEIEKALERTT